MKLATKKRCMNIPEGTGSDESENPRANEFSRSHTGDERARGGPGKRPEGDGGGEVGEPSALNNATSRRKQPHYLMDVHGQPFTPS